MQVNLNTDSTNFGALKIYKGLRVNRNFYRYNNSVVDLSKRGLEELSDNVDIQIRCRNLLDKGFDIVVNKINKNQLKKIFNFIVGDKLKIRNIDFLTAESAPELLIEKTKEAKEKFLKFREYFSQ